MGTDSPVASSLYTFTDKAAPCQVGSMAECLIRMSDGYVTICRTWKKGDVVELHLPMDVCRVKTNEHVENEPGELAIERGPIVYCLEGKDQCDSTVFDKFIPDGTPIKASDDAYLLRGVTVLTGTARKVGTRRKHTGCALQSHPLLHLEQPRSRPDGRVDTRRRRVCTPHTPADHQPPCAHTDAPSPHPERRARVGLHRNLGLGRE